MGRKLASSQGAFAPIAGDARILAASNRSGVKRPLIWDVRSGERRDLALGDLAGEIAPLDWSPDGRRVLLSQFANARQQLYIYDLDSDTLTRLDHPAGTFRETYFVPSGAIFAQYQNSTTPPRLIELDGGPARRPARCWRSAMRRRAGPGARSHSIHPMGRPSRAGWPCRRAAGRSQPFWRRTAARHPRQPNWYEPSSQMWLDHGFAFLSINYRGSTTFGKQFEEQIWHDLGHWEVEDMAAAHDWLIDQGIAIPDAILLTGWSYGGYLTLQALGTRPDCGPAAWPASRSPTGRCSTRTPPKCCAATRWRCSAARPSSSPSATPPARRSPTPSRCARRC